MKKNYRVYTMLELLDMAKTQAYILDDSISEEEADNLAKQFDREYINTILDAYGEEFDSAKAIIKITKTIIEDQDVADKVAMHKLKRGNFEYKDEMVEFLSVPEIRNHFLKGEIYSDPRTAMNEIYDFANIVVDACHRVDFSKYEKKETLDVEPADELLDHFYAREGRSYSSDFLLGGFDFNL